MGGGKCQYCEQVAAFSPFVGCSSWRLPVREFLGPWNRGPGCWNIFFLFRFLFLISIILFFLLFVQGFHSDRTRCLIRANLKVSPLLNQLKKLTDNNFFISSVFFFLFWICDDLNLDFRFWLFLIGYSRRQNSLTLHDMITILFT